jgi:HD-GYP domain-containing protein (c-di-GMP phosphodiesterase class II)
MGAVVEARDAYTGGHLWRVSQFAKLLASKMGRDYNSIILITVGGYLHDLGKVGVPDEILRKPSNLSNEEYDIVKTHPVIGHELISEHPLSDLAHDPIRHHHEKIDGKGYPDGLDGDTISLHSRIISIADAFDAMTSSRPYRQGLSIEEALSRLDQARETQFDGRLVNHFMEIAKNDELKHVVRHSDEKIPILNCPNCGPVIAVSRNACDGDIAYCRVCASEVKLHRSGDFFEVEGTGRLGNAGQIKPVADMGPIDDFIKQVPAELYV